MTTLPHPSDLSSVQAASRRCWTAPTPRYHPDDERAVRDANRPRLMGIAEAVARITEHIDLEGKKR